MNEELKVGDIVLLKGEEFWKMNVQSPEFSREVRIPSVTGDRKSVMTFVSCAWMDGEGRLQSAEFLVDTLKKA